MKLKNDHIYENVRKIIGKYTLGEAIMLTLVILVKRGVVKLEDIEDTFPPIEEEEKKEKPKRKWYQV